MLLAVIAIAVQGQLPSNQTNNGGEITDEDMIRVNIYIEGMRGFWTGFARSFYSDSRREVNQRCLSNDLADEIFFVVNFMEGKESLMQVVKFVTTSSKILNDNMNYCGYSEAITSIESFCKLGINRCSPQKLIVNFSNNIFSEFVDMQGIAQILRQLPIKNKENAYLAMLQIGVDAGKFIRTIFKFY